LSERVERDQTRSTTPSTQRPQDLAMACCWPLPPSRPPSPAAPAFLVNAQRNMHIRQLL